MQGVGVHSIVVVNLVNASDVGFIEDDASTNCEAPTFVPLPTIKKICWDGRDAQVHALIAYELSVLLSHIFTHVRKLRKLGTHLLWCIKLGMRLLLLISKNN